MKILIIGITLIMTLLWSDEVTATVNQEIITKGTQIELTLKATGKNIKFPDIQSIGDYNIQSTSNMSQSSVKIINGDVKKEISTKRILSFTPDKNMTIPSFKIDIDGKIFTTKPIDITVNKVNSYTPTGTEKFTLQMHSNKKEVFVGEPFLVSIDFSQLKNADLMDFRSQQPNFKGCISKEIKGEQTFQRGQYLIHRFRYVLTPTIENNLTIEPIIAKVAERSRARDNFFGSIFDKPKWSQIISNSLNINIKKPIKETDLIGDFKLTQNIDNNRVKANKPVNVTINITGEGSLENFDSLNYEIDGVTIYSDDAKVTTQLKGESVISNYTKKFVFISDHNFTIPSKSFSAFNFKTNDVYDINIDSYDISVKGTPKDNPVLVHKNITSSNSTISNTKPSINNQTVNSESNIKIWMLLLSFIAGVILTTITLKFNQIKSFKFKSSPYKDSEALKILYPHINNNKEVEDMVRDLYAKKSGDKDIKIDKKRLKELINRYI